MSCDQVKILLYLSNKLLNSYAFNQYSMFGGEEIKKKYYC